MTSRRSFADVPATVAAIRSRIGPDVELVAVTKGFSQEAVDAVIAAGCRMIGENYAQEACSKRFADAHLHFIGRLQSNKVRMLAPIVDVWESVDRASLLERIAATRPGSTVLIQVNATGETGKGGCSPDRVPELLARGLDLNLDVNGLMTVGPTSADPTVTRTAFDLVRRLADELALPTCSMGMTQDLDIAIECGSTRVRVGTALFGERPR